MSSTAPNILSRKSPRNASFMRKPALDRSCHYKILASRKGRPHRITSSDELYFSWGNDIYCSGDRGITQQLCWNVPSPRWKSLAASSRMVARLLRYGIRDFEILPKGIGLAVGRDGIYRGEPDRHRMEKVFTPDDGQPLNLIVDSKNNVLFGDYGFHGPKSIYVSRDTGKTFEPIHTFAAGDIWHIHGIQEDPFGDGYWVFTGDFDQQAGIGLLSPDLSQFDWVARGRQEVRVVQAIIEKDFLCYGTDTQFEPNHIVRFEKTTGKTERVMPVEGSSLYASSFGDLDIITTCVEPSTVNKSRECVIYAKHKNSTQWQRLEAFRKDLWHATLFQLGLIVLPVSRSEASWGAFGGQALEKVDNRFYIFEYIPTPTD